MTQAHSLTPIQRVADMNVAFNNPKGDYNNIDFDRLKRQCRNILDEYVELQAALHGVEPTVAKDWFKTHGLESAMSMMVNMAKTPDLLQLRDSLCDIQVFAAGAQHFMGVDGDADMHAVVDGVMTRFIKDDDDKLLTVCKHAAAGVHHVYFEGDYPTMVMKSAQDQPDAPKGKFLKSASFKETVFPEVK